MKKYILDFMSQVRPVLRPGNEHNELSKPPEKKLPKNTTKYWRLSAS